MGFTSFNNIGYLSENSSDSIHFHYHTTMLKQFKETFSKWVGALESLELLNHLLNYLKGGKRFDDLVTCIRRIATLSKLDVRHRMLLLNGYRDVLVPNRDAWTIVRMGEMNATTTAHKSLAKELKESVEKDILSTCTEMEEFVETLLKKGDCSIEETVFYRMIKADVYHTQTLIQAYDTSQSTATDAMFKRMAESYESLYDFAKRNVPATDISRLTIALNYAEFFRKEMKSSQEASAIASWAYGEFFIDYENLPAEEGQLAEKLVAERQKVVLLLKELKELHLAEHDPEEDYEEERY